MFQRMKNRSFGNKIIILFLLKFLSNSLVISNSFFILPPAATGQPSSPTTPMVTWFWNWPVIPNEPTNASLLEDISLLVDAGQEGYYIADKAWHKHNSFTYVTDIVPLTTAGPVASQGDDGSDETLIIILASSVLGAVLLLIGLGTLLWRLFKTKNNRILTEASSPEPGVQAPSILLAPASHGLPPVEETHRTFPHYPNIPFHPNIYGNKGKTNLKATLQALLPPLPGEVNGKTQFNSIMDFGEHNA